MATTLSDHQQQDIFGLPDDLIGKRVRFRRRPAGTWRTGRLTRLERDGSLGLHDDKQGAWRALPITCVEIETHGPKGGKVWRPATDLIPF